MFVCLTLLMNAYANEFTNGKELALKMKSEGIQKIIGSINSSRDMSVAKEEKYYQNENLIKHDSKKASSNDPLGKYVYQESAKNIENKIDVDNGTITEEKEIEENNRIVLNGGCYIRNGEKICLEPVKCADGTCEKTPDEILDTKDVNDALGELVVVNSSANDVSNNKKNTHTSIFSGHNLLCKKDVIDAGNCCSNRAREFRCTKDEKILSQAKNEGRALYVGEIKKNAFERKESWCVFPTKLAYLIQIKGRYKQLGINFGFTNRKENHANCRGITPSEFSRINLKKINLREVGKRAKSQVKKISQDEVVSRNQNKIEIETEEEDF